MEKRGISPLIATVLILGFTVALAAVIMTWGTAFTKKMQEQTEETSNVKLICATEVPFEIKGACFVSGNNYKLIIANNGNRKIEKFQVRFYKSPGEVKSVSDVLSTGIIGFGIETAASVDSTFAGTVKQVDAIPVIKIGTKEVTCSENIATFGDVNSDSVIANC